MTGIVFSACASFLVRITKAKTVSVFDSRKKRIKTLASTHCGRKNFSFLLQLLIYFCLTDTTQAQFSFAWTSPAGLPYKKYCDVYNTDSSNYQWSCLCAVGDTWITNKGKQSFFICYPDITCDDHPFRVSGYCAQCAAGTFYGNAYAEGELGSINQVLQFVVKTTTRVSALVVLLLTIRLQILQGTTWHMCVATTQTSLRLLIRRIKYHMN